jgi:hypothetical protein
MYLYFALSVAQGILGAVQGVRGSLQLKDANTILEESTQERQQAENQLKVDLDATNKIAQSYAEKQVKAYECIKKSLGENDRQVLDAIEVLRTNDLKKVSLQVNKILKPIAVNAVTNTVCNAIKVGFSSTHRQWSTNLLKTETGLLRGGIGRTIFLSSAIVGPTVMTIGFTLAEVGDQSMLEAEEYRQKIKVDIKHIEAARVYLNDYVNPRLQELQDCLDFYIEQLDKPRLGLDLEFLRKPLSICISCLNRFLDFFRKLGFSHWTRFKDPMTQVQVYRNSILEILSTPVFNEEGKLTTEIGVILEKYKQYAQV